MLKKLKFLEKRIIDLELEIIKLRKNFIQTVCLKGLTLLDAYDNNTAYKINSCTKQNPNFECPLYEKKWWLFWVK